MLNQLSKATTRGKKRVGRGYGSGKGGHTSGRGQKGQKSRSGYKAARRGFEGGQMPLSRRLPKLKGFSRGFATSGTKYFVISLDTLNKFKDGETINPEILSKAGIIKNTSQKQQIKLLANGKLERKLSLENIKVSAQAKVKIEANGGSVK